MEVLSALGQKQTRLRYVVYDHFTVMGSSFGQSGICSSFSVVGLLVNK